MSSKTDSKENADDQVQDTIAEEVTNLSAGEVAREFSKMVMPQVGASTIISYKHSGDKILASEPEIVDTEVIKELDQEERKPSESEEIKESNEEKEKLSEPKVDIEEIKESNEEKEKLSEPKVDIEDIKEPNKEINAPENKVSKVSIIVLSDDDIGTTSSWNGPKEIFRLAEVEIYSINDDSSSAELLSSEDLRIMEVPGRLDKGNFNQNSVAPAFIQVGEWVSPLIPFNSFIYRSEEGHYIFPDPKREKPGACTVLVIPFQALGLEIDELESILKKFTGVENFPSLPPMMFGDTGKLIEKALEEKKPTSKVDENPKGNRSSNGVALIHIMSNNLTQPDGTNPTKVTKSRSQTDVIRAKSKSLNKDQQNSKSAQNTAITAVANTVRHDYPDGCGPHFSQRNANTPMIYHTGSDLSTKIADGIMAGAEVVARGLRFGAIKTSELIEQGTGVLKGSIDPASSPKKIHSKIHQGVKTVKNFTGKAVEISGYVVQELSNITVSLALSLSPYLRDTTTTLVSKAIGNNEESSYLVDNVLEVTTGTFQGIQMVYSGLNAAAKELAKSITNNTVDVVVHCYGNQAGEIIDDAAETVGNIALTGTNTQALNPISVINHAAKNTGTVLLTKEKTRTDYYHQPSEPNKNTN